MKRFVYVLGILAVLIACAPMSADAIQPKKEITPIQPPREIGDDDQPDKNAPGSGPGIDASSQSQLPTSPAVSERRDVRVWLGRKCDISDDWMLRLLDRIRGRE